MSYMIQDGVLKLSIGSADLFPDIANMTAITIPEGVTELGNQVFANCRKLREVVLPSTLQQIDSQAFRNCDALTSITGLTEDVGLGPAAFKGCRALADAGGFVILNGILFDYFGTQEEVTIPESVQVISASTFFRQETLKVVHMGGHVQAIGARAFSQTALQQIVLPDSIRIVPEGCFADCFSLTNVQLNNGLLRIERNAFDNCTLMEEIVIPDSVSAFDGFSNCTSLKRINLPAAVKEFSSNAFFKCKALPFLRIPVNTTPGSPYCFLMSTLLVMEKHFSAPSAAIVDDTIRFLTATTLLTIDGNVPCRMVFVPRQNMGSSRMHSFSWSIYDDSLVCNSVKLPVTLQTLAMLCRLRWPVELPENVRSIYTENVCKNVKKIAPYVTLFSQDSMIPLLEEIGALTDKNRKNLMPLMGIGEVPAKKAPAKKASTSKGTPASSEKTPAQLKKEWTFKKLDDGSLRLNSYKGTDQDVIIPAKIGNDAVTVIGKECLCCSDWLRITKEQRAARSRIRSVTISEGITTIGEEAFFCMPELETVTLPSTLQTIDTRAFAYCAKLRSINVDETVVVSKYAFDSCTSLKDENGFCILGGTLHAYYGDAVDVIIPAHVRQLTPHAFNAVSGQIRSLVVPDGVTELPDDALGDCSNLESVTIPSSVCRFGFRSLPELRGRKLTIYGYTDSEAERFAHDRYYSYDFCSIDP